MMEEEVFCAIENIACSFILIWAEREEQFAEWEEAKTTEG